MNKGIVRQILNIIGLAGVLIVNGLANILPLNNLSTGEISDRFQVFFVPAGYVFSIWGLIYLGLIAFGIYQALPSTTRKPPLGEGWLLVPGQLSGEYRLVVLLALRAFPTFISDDDPPAAQPNHCISSAGYRTDSRFNCRDLVCECALQPVSGMDNSGDNRQCHFTS